MISAMWTWTPGSAANYQVRVSARSVGQAASAQLATATVPFKIKPGSNGNGRNG
jgi:hypothetical protein